MLNTKTINTNSARVEASKARKKSSGFVEMRSLWAHPDDVALIRDFAAKLMKKRKPQKSMEAKNCAIIEMVLPPDKIF